MTALGFVPYTTCTSVPLQIIILYLNTMDITFIANCNHLFWNFIPSMKVKLFLSLIKFIPFKLNSLSGQHRLKNTTKSSLVEAQYSCHIS